MQTHNLNCFGTQALWHEPKAQCIWTHIKLLMYCVDHKAKGAIELEKNNLDMIYEHMGCQGYEPNLTKEIMRVDLM